MLALVVALGALGFVVLASLVLLSPGMPAKPYAEALPLRSLGIVPFEARGDPSLAEAATRLGNGVARALAESMQQAHVVAGRASVVRFHLEGDVRATNGDAELALRVIDARDGRVAERALVRVARARLREPDALALDVAATAQRIVIAAMLRAAAD